MIVETIFGFLFMLGWALSYAYVARVKSTPRAILGVFLLYGVMLLFFKLRFESYKHGGSLLGWLMGIASGFFAGLWLVQKHGPDKMTEESAVAMLLVGPVILVGLLIAVMLLF